MEEYQRMFVFLDNRTVPESEAVVSVYDHGFLYGDGIYETMRAYGGVVFMLRRHIERLARSASMIGLKLPEEGKIIDAIYQTLGANDLSEAYIRITVSRGKGPIGLDPGLCREPTFIVITEQFRGYPVSCREKGMRLILAKTRRNAIEAVDPKIKSLNFLNNILAKKEAKEKGADEAIMLNTAGFLTEGTVCNIFFVGDGVLFTPSTEAGILDGITRGLVIALAREIGIPVEEGMFRPADLFRATEVFFTNTSAEIMPVASVDNVGFRPGEVAGRLSALYRKAVDEYIRDNKK